MNENVIIVDADYIDRVAFNLIVNFERMLGRRIPQADMARWIDCVALDGGIRDGEQQTHVVLIHDKQNCKLQNFVPADYEQELGGQAFKDRLGEFVISALPVEELTTKEDFFVETLQVVLAQKETKRVMIVPGEDLYRRVMQTLQKTDTTDHEVTVFSMQPAMAGNAFRHEILGFSLMSALGIRSDEINPNQ